MAEIIIKSALEKFAIGCILQKPTDSCYFLMLKKYADSVCYQCGSGLHARKDCNFSRRLKCSHCGSDKHHISVCAYKFLPYTHCGQVGHYVGSYSECPLWHTR